jgi:hypothetical protein
MDKWNTCPDALGNKSVLGQFNRLLLERVVLKSFAPKDLVALIDFQLSHLDHIDDLLVHNPVTCTRIIIDSILDALLSGVKDLHSIEIEMVLTRVMRLNVGAKVTMQLEEEIPKLMARKSLNSMLRLLNLLAMNGAVDGPAFKDTLQLFTKKAPNLLNPRHLPEVMKLVDLLCKNRCIHLRAVLDSTQKILRMSLDSFSINHVFLLRCAMNEVGFMSHPRVQLKCDVRVMSSCQSLSPSDIMKYIMIMSQSSSYLTHSGEHTADSASLVVNKRYISGFLRATESLQLEYIPRMSTLDVVSLYNFYSFVSKDEESYSFLAEEIQKRASTVLTHQLPTATCSPVFLKQVEDCCSFS